MPNQHVSWQTQPPDPRVHPPAPPPPPEFRDPRAAGHYMTWEDEAEEDLVPEATTINTLHLAAPDPYAGLGETTLTLHREDLQIPGMGGGSAAGGGSHTTMQLRLPGQLRDTDTVQIPRVPLGGPFPPGARGTAGAHEAVDENVPPLRKNRIFRMLWVGAGSSMLGVRTATAAYPLLILWSTGSPAQAGLVAFAALLPQLFLLLPAGALVDRWNRRRTMLMCDLLGLSSMASLAGALLLGKLWVGHVMIVAFIEGGAVIFYRLSERALIRNVVHSSHLSQALSQNEARGHAAGLLGQPAGAGLFSLARWAPFLTATLAHVIALCTVLTVRRNVETRKRRRKQRHLRSEIAEGLRWVWSQRFLRAALFVISGSNVAFQVMSLSMVVIVKEGGHPAYMVGAVGLLGGIGGILGAMAASWCMKRLRIQDLLCLALAVWTLLMSSVAFIGHPVALGLVSAGTSMAGALLNVAAGVHQVKITPDEMQGRASSVVGLVSSGLNSLGSLIGGVLLSLFGGVDTMAGVGVGMAVITLMAVISPSIRNAEDKPMS